LCAVGAAIAWGRFGGQVQPVRFGASNQTYKPVLMTPGQRAELNGVMMSEKNIQKE